MAITENIKYFGVALESKYDAVKYDDIVSEELNFDRLVLSLFIKTIISVAIGIDERVL